MRYPYLDLLLQRSEDRPLWAGADLAYVVLDEFHTYDGAQGTDVAMLLRRLAAAVGASREGRPLGSVCPVSALKVLGGEKYDDLDGSNETLAGYRSVLSGGVPGLHGLPDWEAEREAIAELIASWGDVPHEQIAIAVPTDQMVTEAGATLAQHGIRPLEIGPAGPRGDDGVHIGTMFRFKGLDYQHMIIAGASDGLVPRVAVQRLRDTEPVRYRREMQRGRSLLFVAATRARDSLNLFWHGTPSPFLSDLLAKTETV